MFVFVGVNKYLSGMWSCGYDYSSHVDLYLFYREINGNSSPRIEILCMNRKAVLGFVIFVCFPILGIVGDIFADIV